MDMDQLPESLMTVVFPSGIPVMLVKKAGNIYAMSNKCAHMGCTLSRGTLAGFIVRCPCHEWDFDLRTGVFVTTEEISIPVYESKVDNNQIFIKI